MTGLSTREEYVHDDDSEVRSISGGYRIEKEMLLELDGRKILCLVGHGVVDSSCCGVGGCLFAYVPGFLIESRVRRNASGQWVSLVEPIVDPEIQKRIRRSLERAEMVQQVNFR